MTRSAPRRSLLRHAGNRIPAARLAYPCARTVSGGTVEVRTSPPPAAQPNRDTAARSAAEAVRLDDARPPGEHQEHEEQNRQADAHGERVEQRKRAAAAKRIDGEREGR